jgi:hypothetical protein
MTEQIKASHLFVWVSLQASCKRYKSNASPHLTTTSPHHRPHCYSKKKERERAGEPEGGRRRVSIASSEGSGVSAGGRNTARSIPGAEVREKVDMFTQLATGQSGPSAGSSPGRRRNGSALRGLHADSKEDLSLLAAARDGDADDASKQLALP